MIAWSAGAMALAERVILYHDMAPQGRRREVYAEGLGCYPAWCLFPHAAAGCGSTTPVRLGELARRFAPARCVLLADGVRLDRRPGGELPADARVIGPDGASHPADRRGRRHRREPERDSTGSAGGG